MISKSGEGQKVFHVTFPLIVVFFHLILSRICLDEGTLCVNGDIIVNIIQQERSHLHWKELEIPTMRYVGVRGLNNFQSFGLRARSSRWSACIGRTKATESGQLSGLWRYTSSSPEMWFKLRQQKKGSSRLAVSYQSLEMFRIGETGVW